MIWHRIAKRLTCTVTEAKRRTNAIEFAEYCELFNRADKAKAKKWTKQEKWEHYLAAIRAELRRSWVTNKANVNDKDFFITWIMKNGDEEVKQVLSKEEMDKRELALEKYSWGIISGKAIPKSRRRKQTPNGVKPHPSKPDSSPES